MAMETQDYFKTDKRKSQSFPLPQESGAPQVPLLAL